MPRHLIPIHQINPALLSGLHQEAPVGTGLVRQQQNTAGADVLIVAIQAEPGTGDKRVWSETGCTCVLITSTKDILR